ncbi:MAG TPA: hypothetical protein VFJ00_03380 [Candidatus Limnocylindria bacterium]|nr:hypothetical protein [Candidatus Limnocylindria bacterium]
MRSVPLVIAVFTVAGILPECGTQSEATFEPVSIPQVTPEARTPAPTVIPPSPTPAVSLPEAVAITFRLTVNGEAPADAAFALRIDTPGVVGSTTYLCSDDVGYPACATGESYEVAAAFAPGTRVAYVFSLESEMISFIDQQQFWSGEVTVGNAERVISATWDEYY